MSLTRFAPDEAIAYTAARTPFGWAAVGATARGLCWLSLAATRAEAEAALRKAFPGARLTAEPALARAVASALASVRSGARAQEKLDLRGSAFELQVWKALRRIPRGQSRSYGELARTIGLPGAARAVGRACAANRIALLVPCHRVVGATGRLTGYRWGLERKRQLLAAEAAPARASSSAEINRP